MNLHFGKCSRVVRMTYLSAALVLPLSAFAQTEVTESEIVSTDTAVVENEVSRDSLVNRVKELEERVTAQEEDATAARIWKRKKYIGFLTGSQTLKQENVGNLENPETTFKSKMAFGFQWDWFHIRFHRKPIAKMMMIGLDIALDLNYAQYKDLDVTDEGIDLADAYDDGSGYSEEGDEDLDLGLHQIDAGLAIGPSIQIAPLTSLGGGWRDVKVGLYYHLIPSYSGILIDDGNDINVNHSFVMFNSFGIGLTWKALSLGCEWRWGSHKYKNFNFDEEGYDEDDYYNDYANGDTPSIDDFFNTNVEKIKYKTSSTRFYIRLNF